MSAKIFGCTVALLLLMENGFSTPVVEYDKGLRYEEYVIEHEISAQQAKNSALTTDINSIVSPPGCQRCTPEEKKYCLGVDLINDHCCCDKHNEVLPFIPHTCYLGPEFCTPIARDCAEYSRLRTCCCDKYVLLKWKEKSNASNFKNNSGAYITLIIVNNILVHIFVYYFIL